MTGALVPSRNKVSASQRLNELLPWNWKKAQAADTLAAHLASNSAAQTHGPTAKSEFKAALAEWLHSFEHRPNSQIIRCNRGNSRKKCSSLGGGPAVKYHMGVIWQMSVE